MKIYKLNNHYAKLKIEAAGETDVQIYETSGGMIITEGKYEGVRHMYISHARKMISRKAVLNIVKELWGDGVKFTCKTGTIGVDVREVAE